MAGLPDHRYELPDSLPPRLALFGEPTARPIRCPSVVFYLFGTPLFFFVFVGAIFACVAVFYGYGVDATLGLMWRMALFWSPSLLLTALYIFGRLELVDALPDPKAPAQPKPARLALPDAAEGPLRPMGAEALPSRRWSSEAVSAYSGCGALAAALLISLIQQDSFDSVLGIKLGGVRFHGTYWNRWWFVFYGLCYGGLFSLGAGFLLFARRLNRRDDA